MITATSNHPFWAINSSQWTDAGKLNLDSILYSRDENNISIVGLRNYSQEATVYNLTVANDHTYFVGVGGVLGHNAGCDIFIDREYSFNRRGKSYFLEQGNEKSGWHHIYLRHFDSSLWQGGTKFPHGWGKEDVIRALGKTIKHGQKSKWYNLTIFEKKMNIAVDTHPLGQQISKKYSY